MRASRFLMVALFLVSAVLVVEAQQPRPGGGRGGLSAYTFVLTNKDLQAEIKITDEQKDKLKAVGEKVGENTKKAQGLFKDAGKDEDKQKEARAEFAKINAENKKLIEEVLNTEQKKRLAQIDVQLKGVRAFTNEAIAKDLGITEAQTSKIKGILEEYEKDTKDLGFGGFGKDKEKADENRKKREKITKGTFADIEETLTADQKTKWKDMTGESFDTAKLFNFGGGFGNFGKNKDKAKEKTKD